MKISPITNFVSPVFKASEVKENKNQKDGLSFKDKTVLLTSSLAVLGIGAAVGIGIIQGKKVGKLQKEIEKLKLESNENLKNVIKSLSRDEKLIPYEIKSFDNTALYEKFVNSGKNFTEFLRESFDDAAKIKEFLFSVTSDEQVSQKFINEVIADPRESLSITKLLRDKIGGVKNLTEWLQEEGGYYTAYKKFAENLFNNSENIDELLKVSPNWHLFAFQMRWHDRIKFGELPEEFKFVEDLKNFANWLAYLPLERGRAKKFEYSMQYMMIEPLSFGASSKIPLKIQMVNWDDVPTSKPYVVKVQSRHFRHGENSNAKIAEAYRSDSVFLDAQIDRYLNLNNCKNANKLYFYDFDSEMAIYGLEDGFAPDLKHGGIRYVNKKLKDMNELGIYYNDATPSNFIEKDGKLIVIDIGESSFIDPLRPGIPHLHFDLPNWAGRALPDLRMLQL